MKLQHIICIGDI